MASPTGWRRLCFRFGSPTRRYRSRAIISAVLAVGLIGAAGCSQGTGSASSGPGASPASASIGSSAIGTVRGKDTATAAPASTTKSTAGRGGHDGDRGTTKGSNAAKGAVSSDQPPPVTTPVPPPNKGNIHQTVAPKPERAKHKVKLTAVSHPKAGVSVRLVDIKSITTKAREFGEVAGPGLAITVRVTNASEDEIDLSNVIVTMAGANKAPAIAVSGEPATPLAGSLAPGKTSEGVYAFTIPSNQRNPISVRFSYSAEAPIALFVGDAQ